MLERLCVGMKTLKRKKIEQYEKIGNEGRRLDEIKRNYPELLH